MYKVLIADDHPLFRDAMVNIIAHRFPDIEFWETEDVASTIEYAKAHDDIDLILLDLNMPGMVGLNGLLELRNECPTTPIVVVSAEQEKQIILQTITYGAVGFITKSSSKEIIGDAIESVFDGNVYLPSDIIRCDGSRNGQINPDKNSSFTVSKDALSSLTRRQLMVLRHMIKGEANKQIAYNLNISETTVKSHVSAILNKLGVYNRVQAVIGCSDIDFKQY